MEHPAAARAACAGPAQCWNALVATVALYADLRERLAPAALMRRADAERAVRDFLLM